MPRGFAFPDRNVDAWMPMSVVPVVDGGTRRLMIFSALARLKPDTTMTQVAAEGTARARGAPDVGPAGLALFGSGGEPALLAAGAVDVLTADLRPSLLLLLGAVAMLFAASTASVVLLQMARAASRRREMAVRMAIGAGVGRVARGWLIESLLLAAAGGAAGVALSIAVQRALPGLLPPDFPRLEDVRIDGWVTAVATALSLVSGLACGMVPALQARATSLAGLLAGHSVHAEGSARTRSARLRAGLMIGQVAIACALLAASGLLARSLFALTTADRGYDPHNLLTARLPLSRPATFQDKAAMLEAIRSRMAALPGVTDVAYGNALPFVTSGGFHGFNIDSPRRDGTKVQMQTIVRSVSPSYFRALRIRLVAGRLLDDADLATTRGVVVVNRSFATRYLGTSPVGTIMSLGIHGKKDWEVVGVVDDMSQGGLSGRPPSRFGGIGESPQPEMFFTSAQVTQTVQEMVLVIRTAGDPVQLTPALRTAVREADASVALDSIMTMDERVRASLARPRVYVVLLTAFAACALVIAMVGLFGVLSYTTARRTREIGVRTALGARSRDVAGLVVRQALVVSTAGAAIGLALAYLLARSISSLLYGVAATDLVSFTAAPALLVAASLAACAIPARRAARVDPLIAMKSE
jgi:predicted permease